MAMETYFTTILSLFLIYSYLMQYYKPKKSYMILKVFKIFSSSEEIHLLLIFNL